MLTKINLEHLVFLDIETVPEHRLYDDVDDAVKAFEKFGAGGAMKIAIHPWDE